MNDRAARAAARASLPVRVVRQGEEPAPDLLATTTPEERIGMVTSITHDLWILTVRPFPTYSRSSIPLRVTRLHDDG